MRAVIIATGQNKDRDPLKSRHLPAMLPLLDRPFVQHLVEFFAEQGVRQFDFVLGPRSEAIQRHLGDGTRWGCRCRYVLASDPEHPYGELHRLGLDRRSSEPVLFGHADQLPVVRLHSGCWVANLRSQRPVCLAWSGQLGLLGRLDGLGPAIQQPPSGHSQGHGQGLPGCPSAARDRPGADPVRDASGAQRPEPAQLLAAQQIVLNKQVGSPPLLFGGLEVAPGIWVAGNARVSPRAELCPPVFIGPCCTVGAGTRLGPHAVVGSGCFIDRRSRISHSLLLAGTYVGEGMILDGAVVDRDLAVNPRDNSTKLFADPLTLGSVPSVSLPGIAISILSRLAALLLLVKPGSRGKELSVT